MIKKHISVLLIILILFSLVTVTSASENSGTEITDYSGDLDSFSAACTELGSSGKGGSAALFSLSGTHDGSNRVVAKFISTPTGLDAYGADKVLIYNKLAILQFSDSELTAQALKKLSARADVKYAEKENYAVLCEDKMAQNWGIPKVGLLNYSAYLNHMGITGSETVVAVVDSGLQTDHPYFLNKGRITDGFVFVEEEGMADTYGHGTHVAGIVAANTPDNIKIQPYRAFVGKEANSTNVCNAIEKAIENNVDIINMSFVIIGHNERMHELAELAHRKGIIIVGSAGNNHADTSGFCPADSDDIITVAATTSDDVPDDSYSNFGEACDIAAPGTKIYSTYKDSNYAYMSGTSMAAPFVSAAAAMLKSIDKTAALESILPTLQSAAVVPAEWDTAYGTGILSMYKLIQYIENASVSGLNLSYDSYTGIITSEGTVYGYENPEVYLCQYEDDKLVDVFKSDSPGMTRPRFSNDTTKVKIFVWSTDQGILCLPEEYYF